MARGKKIEFINHFKLSRVGIHLLIYCQVVTWSVISALGPRRNRQAAAMAAVLWERTQGRTGMPAEGGRKLPWLGAPASCSPLEEGTGAWLSRGSISCMAAKSTAFGSSLTLLWVIYHPTIFSVFLSPTWNNRFCPPPFQFLPLLFPDCHMSIMHALISCCPVAGSVPLPPTRSTGWAPSSSASSPSSPRRTAGRFRCWITCDGMKDNLCLCAVQPTQYQCMIRSCQRQSSA